MCGIAGMLWRNGNPANAGDLRAMADVQRHRGPDDDGVWTHGSVGFGHRRLSIIDLSSAGHQPMSTPGGSLTVTYNGEIYNYRELREELRALGYAFRSQTDTEVILHAYREWGPGCVQHFNGMWAFALWDARQERLFLSRDRLGEKPLHYLDRAECFVFSSEIKGILTVFPEERRPDYSVLYHLLANGKVSDGEETCFASIRLLRPGHSMLVDRLGTRIWRYWDFQPEEAASRYDYAHPERTLFELLQDAVRLRLRSDVPVGTCLSGGLDSSSVVALASRELDHPINAFSVVYAEDGYDEGQYARLVAERFQCRPHYIRPDGSDWLDVAQRLTWHQEVPSTGPGLYSQWWVMRQASPEVRVLLDGQGGDELLGGYHYFFVTLVLARARALLKNRAVAEIPALMRELTAIESLTGVQLRSALQRYAWRQLRNLLQHRTPALSSRAAGTSHALWEAARARPIVRARPRRLQDDFGNALYYSTTVDSLPALLHWEDRNSMAFSIEARLPFLDPRLVEFCLGLAPELRIRGTVTKWVLRRALEDILPSEITQRKSKMGFPTPFASWSRGIRLKDVEEVLLSAESRKRDILDQQAVKRALEEHRQGGRDHGARIWRWLTLEFWFRQFIDGAGCERPYPKPASFAKDASWAPAGGAHA